MLRLARMVFRLIERLLPAGAVIELVVGETRVRRYGPRVVGAGARRRRVRRVTSGGTPMRMGRYLVPMPGLMYIWVGPRVKWPWL